MFRRSLIAVTAVAALALASCGSTGSTDQTGAGSGTSGASSVAGSGTGGAGSAPAGSSGTAAGPMQSGRSGSDSDSGSSSGAGSASGSATITAGGAMDGQSTMWFSAFCTGIGPAFTAMMSVDPTATGAAKQKAYVTTFNSVGDAFTAAAKTLGSLPPPTITNGDKLASTMVQTLTAGGPAMKQAAADVAAVDPSDEKALAAAIATANEHTGDVLSGMDKIDLDDATQQALREIPACKMFADAGSDSGSGGGDSSSPTTG
jgi:hypothetical protein